VCIVVELTDEAIVVVGADSCPDGCHVGGRRDAVPKPRAAMIDVSDSIGICCTRVLEIILAIDM
jgi:hypothetical protein